MWRLSGIYRDVYLFSTPKVHVRDFFVKCDLDANYRDAMFSVTASVHNYGKANSSKHSVEVELLDADGKPVAMVGPRAASVDPRSEARGTRTQPGMGSGSQLSSLSSERACSGV